MTVCQGISWTRHEWHTFVVLVMFLLVFIQSGLGYSGEGWIASGRFVYLY